MAACDGEAERMMKTLKKVFRISRFAHRSFDQELQKFLRNYRATPHSTTGEAPATLLFNRQMRVRLPEITITQQPADQADRDSKKTTKSPS